MYMEVHSREMFAPPRAALVNDLPSPEETAINQAALTRIIGDHEAYLARRRGAR